MAGQPAIFHALLRPSILQMLRATGYHSTKGAVLDSLTDLAARYLSVLCERTAAHAIHNHGDAGDYGVVDIRLALQDAGALLPERAATEQAWRGDEDLRGIDDFLKWFSGPRMKELMDMGRGDGEIDATDYLSALKKKHSKTGEDTKYHGSLIGRPIDAIGDVQVEGGAITSIDEWITRRRSAASSASPPEEPQTNGHPSPSAASSGLSSVGDRLDGHDDGADDSKMDLV
ncbi:bromodomain associated domain-containing protein [Hirsutella rhossiliensis]|uniref:Bromodomain associated domain-containing protein n=1 Tax=Hirsutella rhossiliensis TaxID=111463 RepID=A0A9P8NA02_9HYPO|nr:bromodomain associated domain-containing protein [Hirsutella rhossiliensis]KAH0967332.1 bromodomain associated domain-containing protein [Hirsutella rhossiliensis]